MSNHDITNDKQLLVLAVDTSSAAAGFALAQGEKLIASINGDPTVPHSRTFFLQVDELLKLGGIRLSDVEVFASATGPGSFTGLRVGLAAIKGLAHSCAKPAVGMNSIDAMALGSELIGELQVLIEAGRSEVYSGVRRVTKNHELQQISQDKVGSLSAIGYDHLPVVSLMPIERLAEISHRQIIQPKRTIAESIALYASELNKPEADNGLRPHYIRPSDAEIKQKR